MPSQYPQRQQQQQPAPQPINPRAGRGEGQPFGQTFGQPFGPGPSSAGGFGYAPTYTQSFAAGVLGTQAGDMSFPTAPAPAPLPAYSENADIEAKAHFQMMINTKDLVISTMSRKYDVATSHLEGQIERFNEEINKLVTITNNMPVEHSIPVSPYATSPPYGNPPTNPERLLKLAENMTNMIKHTNMVVDSLYDAKLEIHEYLKSFGEHHLLPQGWDLYLNQ